MTVLAGDVMRAADFPAAVQDVDTTTISDITATTWTVGSPSCEVDFVAPTSGAVVVTVGGGLRSGSGGEQVFLAVRVTNNAGTPAFVDGPSRARHAVSSQESSTGFQYGSRSYLLDGLEPGGSYNAETRYRVSGGSLADIAARQVYVKPVM